MKNEILNRAADNIRILAAAMVEKAKSGHPGGAMGGADFINVLFSEYLVFDPSDPTWNARDRFFLDPGHMAPMLYAQLALIGKYSIDELKQLRQWGSPTTGHPEFDIARGIENTSGPLGQGHTFAVGAAIAAKFLAARTGNPGFAKETIYAYISDGGIQEEISQGAGRIAGHLGLDNLVMFYDSNDIQLSTECNEVSNEDTAMKYRAWGWNVMEINGNDVDEIRKALDAAKAETERPTLIIGKTIMGKGARKADNTSYEHNCKTHGAPLGGDAFRNTVANLGGNPDEPFVIFDEVKELYADRAKALEGIVAERRAEENAWADANHEKAAEVAAWFENKAPEIDWSKVQQKENDATRNASGAVLAQLAQQVPNMICSSADLSESDKTISFLKETKAFTKCDFSGAFLQAGVAELTMACCCIGMALHGGVIAACATFFVFSDYMKPAVRMAALMELPVKYVWTHDAFRVGEDGPTHEPVEHEAQMRLLEELHNINGRRSMMVLRPADSAEATIAWEMAMENKFTPTALIFTRQDVPDIKAMGSDRYEEALQMKKGGYVVRRADNPDVVLVGNGSEVSLLCDVAVLLEAEGIRVQVVSVPSIGIFLDQPEEYRRSCIPAGVQVFGLTAGLPSTLREVVGVGGYVYGLDRFGASAPYKVLDEKFGFTPQAVLERVKAVLGK